MYVYTQDYYVKNVTKYVCNTIKMHHENYFYLIMINVFLCRSCLYIHTYINIVPELERNPSTEGKMCKKKDQKN